MKLAVVALLLLNGGYGQDNKPVDVLDHPCVRKAVQYTDSLGDASLKPAEYHYHLKALHAQTEKCLAQSPPRNDQERQMFNRASQLIQQEIRAAQWFELTARVKQALEGLTNGDLAKKSTKLRSDR